MRFNPFVLALLISLIAPICFRLSQLAFIPTLVVIRWFFQLIREWQRADLGLESIILLEV